MDHARAGRGLSVLLAACLLLLVLAGCVSGDPVQGSFEREFGGDPAVVGLDLSTADNMPFTGGVGGTVTLRDDVNEEQLRDLVARIVSFREDTVGDEDESRVRIDLAVGVWMFPILATQESSAAVLDAVLALRADPRVRSGTVISTDYQFGLDHVTLVAASASEIPALISDAPAIVATGSGMPSITLRSPNDEHSAVEVSGQLGAWASDAIRAYEVLRPQLPVTAFRAEETAVSVTLADEGDVDAARTIVANVLDPTTITVFYQSNLVTLSPGAHGDQARTVLAAMDVETRARVVGVWTDDRSVTFTADSIPSAPRLAAPIATALGAADFPVTVAVGQGNDQVFYLEAIPRELVADMQTALSLVLHDDVASLHVKPGFSLELEYGAVPAAADLASVAVLLKALSDFDERLCITWPADSFCTTTASTLDVEYSDSPNARVFADAWNDAP